MTVRVLAGDCLVVLDTLEENSIDAVVTDPPYHFTSIVKRFGAEGAAPSKGGVYERSSRGFMGKTWDGGDIAFQPETWAKVLRVMKPGAHLVAFGAPKNYHRLACAIEDAGFEIRDSLMWVTGQGFPKSLNVSKMLGDEVCRCKRPERATPDLQHGVRSVPDADLSKGVASGSVPAHVLLKGVPEYGSQELGAARPEPEFADGEKPSLERWGDAQASARELQGRDVRASARASEADGASGRLHNAASSGYGADVRVSSDTGRSGQPQGSQPSKQSSFKSGTVADECGSQARGSWPVCERCGKPCVPEGLGTALKPAYEPIILARKPLSEKTVAANVLRWGTGALNIDATRIEGQPRTTHKDGNKIGNRPDVRNVYGEDTSGHTYEGATGRWPANLCHDGSEEVLAGFPQTKSGSWSGQLTGRGSEHSGNWGKKDRPFFYQGDEGSAARFFYCAKANKTDRANSKHPTVKPVSLMRWLVRMVTPPNGTVLDLFAGSGTTGQAAYEEGFDAVLIEREAEYLADIERRLGLAKDDAPPLSFAAE